MSDNENNQKCFRCGKPGHLRADCPERTQGERAPASAPSKGRAEPTHAPMKACRRGEHRSKSPTLTLQPTRYEIKTRGWALSIATMNAIYTNLSSVEIRDSTRYTFAT